MDAVIGWFSRHASDLRVLFDLLGLDAPVDDAEALAEWCEREGWYGEHGRQPGRPRFDEATVAAARPLLQRIGLDGQVDPPDEEFDEIVVMGAAGIGMHRRIGLVADSTVRAARMTVLAGLRPHEGARSHPDGRTNDGLLSELLAVDGRFPARPGWSPHPLHLHLQALLGAIDDHAAAAITFPTETDLAVLSLSKHYPHATLRSTLHEPPHGVTNELGQREWATRTWDNPPGNRIPRLVVQNSAPVERHNYATGERIASRPTATSSFAEWLARHETSGSTPDRILVVVNQPHLGRIYQQVRDHLTSAGLSGMSVEVAGCATLQDVDLNLLLGEIPRWIRADRPR